MLPLVVVLARTWSWSPLTRNMQSQEPFSNQMPVTVQEKIQTSNFMARSSQRKDGSKEWEALKNKNQTTQSQMTPEKKSGK